VKRALLLMILVGTALLGVVLYQTDLAAVWLQLLRLGWAGLLLVLLVHLASHVTLAASWLFTVRAVPATPAWLYRLSKVLMVGFALDTTTPLAGFGGEPIKAILLKRQYGIPYRDATASLVLARTTDLAGELLFVLVGLALLLSSPRPALEALPYRLVACVGVALMAAFMGLLVFAQQRRALGLLRRWLERRWSGTRAAHEHAVAALRGLQEVEDRLAAYYRAEPGRCALSLGLAFAGWLVDAGAVYLGLTLLGHPVTVTDAVLIEAFLTIVRSALFMVPADLGTQEGALMLICGALLGSPAAGLALAAIRRARDLVWIPAGLALASHYSLRPGSAMRTHETVALATSPSSLDRGL
jgi:uncharacterized protein (TIRG00374 family)